MSLEPNYVLVARNEESEAKIQNGLRRYCLVLPENSLLAVKFLVLKATDVNQDAKNRIYKRNLDLERLVMDVELLGRKNLRLLTHDNPHDIPGVTSHEPSTKTPQFLVREEKSSSEQEARKPHQKGPKQQSSQSWSIQKPFQHHATAKWCK